MTTDNVTLSALTNLIQEASSAVFTETINRRTALISSGALKRKDIEGEEWVEQLMVGGNASVTFSTDRGTRPVGESNLPVEVRLLPKVLTSVMTMGNRARLAKMGAKRAAGIFDVNLKQQASAMQAFLNRAFFDKFLGSPISDDGNPLPTWSNPGGGVGVENSEITLKFTDLSGFRPNMAVVYADVSAPAAYTVRVKSVAPANVTPFGGSLSTKNVAGTVTFINDIKNPATGSVVTIAAASQIPATADGFYLRGAMAGFGAASVALSTGLVTGLNDFLGANGTASYLGHTPSTLAGWEGGDENVGASYTQEAINQFLSRILTGSGEPVSHLVMNRPLGLVHAYVSETKGATFGLGTAAVNAARPKGLGSGFDKFGDIKRGDVDGAITISGIKPVVDEFCPHASVFALNSEYLDLGVWTEVEPEMEAGSPLMVSRSKLEVEVYYTGTMDLATRKRSAHGAFRGITGL